MRQDDVDRMWSGILEGARRRDAGKPAPRRKRPTFYKPPIPTRDYTDEEWIELGKQMAANPKAIATNIEGQAYLDYTTEQKRQRRDRDGCCGGEADAEGFCFGLGRCTRHFETQSCLTFVANVIAWLEEINEQTSLAAVAVRLSDSSSFNSEVSNV